MNRSASPSQVLLRDRYEDDRPLGGVIGTVSPSGARRLGVDVEGVLGIDHGALRIEPLIEAGWGRAGIAYGPYRREAGLTFAVHLLNGHNTSQSENLSESLRLRVARWALGPASAGSAGVVAARLLRFVRHPRRRALARRLRWWARLRPGRPVPELDENLAVGWFAAAAPRDPIRGGAEAFVMHALGPRNGELWLANGRAPALRALPDVQNVPLYLVASLRSRGAIFYAASLAGARGLAGYPSMRPLGIDPLGEEPVLHAGIHQAVLGQIGFRSVTRVLGAAVAQIPELSADWYGTAHAADRLCGEGALAGTGAEVGGVWTALPGTGAEGADGRAGEGALAGRFERAAEGACANDDGAAILLSPAEPSGLVHVLIDFAEPRGGLVWRCRDRENRWEMALDGDRARLRLVLGGAVREIANAGIALPSGRTAASLQLLDDGRRIAAFLDGARLFDIEDERLGDAPGVGLLGGAGARFRSFEAHPRAVPLPEALRLGEPWAPRGGRLVVADELAEPAGDLAGRTTPVGARVWRREIGAGTIGVTEERAGRVRATKASPNPGRTAYTVAWTEPRFVDLAVTSTPPGTGRGQGERGRCGLIAWQDAGNYLIVSAWLDDWYEGASVSSFVMLDGFEEIYDAVWTNVGDRITWGQPFRLRLAFDGRRFRADLGAEPVLVRSIQDVYPDARRLEIRRVGVVANWEWGDDTGSLLRRFEARGDGS